MGRDELQFRALDAEAKFEYQFAILIFAALALSIQFSPPLGNSYKSLLVVGWVSFSLAGLVAGWRLSMLPLAYRLNWGELTQAALVNGRKEKLQDALFIRALKGGTVLSETGRPMSPSDYTAMLAENEGQLQELKGHREKLFRKFQFGFWIQVTLFLVGVILNGIFLSYGLLEKNAC